MKYISSYKSFESISVPNEQFGRSKEISDNISDICAELSDEGYFILNNFLHIPEDKIYGNFVAIRKEDSSLFNIQSLSKTVIRINEYLKQEGYQIGNITAHYNDSVHYNQFYLLTDTTTVRMVKMVTLIIDKID